MEITDQGKATASSNNYKIPHDDYDAYIDGPNFCSGRNKPIFKPEWSAYEFLCPVSVHSYDIARVKTKQPNPQSWTFEGSNDGETWDTLYRFLGLPF